MIPLATNPKFAILLPHTNKVLADVLKQASPEQLFQLKEGKDLKSILNSLFHAKIDNTKSDAVLLDILKNNGAFKSLGNFSEELKALLTTLKSEPSLAPKLLKLEAFLQPASPLDVPVLKEKIVNSGIFMESKLGSLLEASPSEFEERIGYDVKAQLLLLGEEIEELHPLNHEKFQTKIDQLVTQIDYHQLLSHLNNSNSLYFPFTWDQLERGSLSFKKSKGEKFYCEIDLVLKQYGKVDLLMALYENNQLDIQVHTQQGEFKTLLQEHLGELKRLLMNAGITPRSIRIYEASEVITSKMSAYTPEENSFHSSFEERV
ncbi:MAG: flagellar hook-length control protein FliK [Sulfuricurvum sp.]|nr:flagellar hook-length control protein FliK [Sulfuricurvum sp.]